MTPRFSIPAALGWLLLAQTLAAQEQPEAPDAPSADARVASDAGSLVLLLEFIGEFTTEDGEWVDPELLVDAETEDAESSAGQTENCSDPQCE
jgi:hypothetical protein